MTVRPVSSATPVRAPTPAGERPAADLVERFTAAVRKRELPLAGTPVRGEKLPPDVRVALPVAPRQGQQPPPADPGTQWRKPRTEPEPSDIALFAATAQPAAPTMAPPPAAAVDPSAFADMMNQLWLREQNRTTRELKVRFGDAAWPATGASMLRLDDGSLSITVDIARHGNPGDLDALRRQLESRGLAIADLSVSTEP